MASTGGDYEDSAYDQASGCLGTVRNAACPALLMLGHAFAHAYAASSLGTWAAAAALALAWLGREAALTVRSAVAGLDSFAPHLANTYY